MAGSIPLPIAVEAICIMVERFLVFVSPLLFVGALWWLANRTDWIIARLFPQLEWEKNLGWFNIRAERRAKRALRLLGCVIYLTLAAVLLVIPWEMRSIVDELTPDGTDNWPLVGDVVRRLIILVSCAGAWVVFLAQWLVPKIRVEREDAGLRKYRAEIEALEGEKKRRKLRKPATLITEYKKPRSNSHFEVELTGRPTRLRRPPGE